MASIIKTTADNGQNVFQVSINGGTTATLPTANKYLDKDIIIKARNVGDAADVEGTININTNGTHEVAYYQDARVSVAPLIITQTVTVPTSGQNTISFHGLPSMPRAWTLDCAQSTANVSWNNLYRCISARYDGNKTYTYTAYKGNQGSAIPYIYMVDNGNGFTQEYNNGTLTFTTNGTGSQTYCGPFLARTYVLMAICDNDGSTDIYRGGGK